MRFPLEIAEQLRALTADADTPGGYLADSLETLFHASLHAVPSLLAISLSVSRHNHPNTVTAQTAASNEPVRASLQLRLPTHAGSSGSTLTLYAADPRALDQLGADLPTLLDLHRDRAILEQHLTRPTDTASTLGQTLDDTSVVDRALGVLLEQGVLPADGLTELQRRALDSGTNVAGAARHLLTAITPTPDTDR